MFDQFLEVMGLGYHKAGNDAAETADKLDDSDPMKTKYFMLALELQYQAKAFLHARRLARAEGVEDGEGE